MSRSETGSLIPGSAGWLRIGSWCIITMTNITLQSGSVSRELGTLPDEVLPQANPYDGSSVWRSVIQGTAVLCADPTGRVYAYSREAGSYTGQLVFPVA